MAHQAAGCDPARFQCVEIFCHRQRVRAQTQFHCKHIRSSTRQDGERDRAADQTVRDFIQGSVAAESNHLVDSAVHGLSREGRSRVRPGRGNGADVVAERSEDPGEQLRIPAKTPGDRIVDKGSPVQ